MGERLDPETLRLVMTRYFDEMRAVIDRHGGTVEKFIGDAVMAVFGVPTVHEDDALRAVRAAAEMRTTLRELNEELERDRAVSISARTGVNTGEVVAGDPSTGGSFVTGDAVNTAARLEQAAAPGQILMGEATRRLVRDAVVAEPIESLSAKGKTEPMIAFELLEVMPGVAGLARHLEAPMVGRTTELETLDGALERSKSKRACGLVTIVGAPGVGKSRLIDEFTAVHRDDARVVQGRCLSYGDGITYWPVVEILTSLAGILETDDIEGARAKIAGLLDREADAPGIVERLAGFLGLSGTSAGPEETHWAIRKLFEAVAARRPFVPVFEDVHWAEPALLDLLEHITAWSADAPILMLCTARPELLQERAGWGTAAPRAVSIHLEPLSGSESDLLIANLVGMATLPDEARGLLSAAEGNPLFLEQLIGMLMDEGHLRLVGDAWVVGEDLSDVSIPPTITGILSARIEGLTPSERDVLERGSVEGRVFHWNSLTALSDGSAGGRIGRDLLSLVRRGLIDAAPALFGVGEAFSFRHALVRDSAYARLSKGNRAELHERHARWLEETAGGRMAEFEDILAYHLEQAVRYRGELGPLHRGGLDLAAEAAGRLSSAGRRAADRGDVRAAANLFERAIGLLDPDDVGRADALWRLGEVLGVAGELDRATETLAEAVATASRAGDARLEFRSRLAAAMLSAATDPEGSTAELDRLAGEGIPMLEALGDDEGLARAWKGLGEVALTHGRAAPMVEAYERAALHAERAGDRAALADALGWLALATLWDLTPPEAGIERTRELRARLPDHHLVESMTQITEALHEAMRARFDRARTLFRNGRAILVDIGSGVRAAGLQAVAGRIEQLAGDLGAAERELRRSVDELSAMGERGYLSTHAAELGQVLYAQDRLDEAQRMTEVSEEAAASDDLISQALWRGPRAKILARRGDDDAALVLIEEALSLLERSDFVDSRWETLADLAEVHQLAGRTEDAARALGQAIELVERKGVVPLIQRFRDRLDDLPKT